MISGGSAYLTNGLGDGSFSGEEQRPISGRFTASIKTTLRANKVDRISGDHALVELMHLK